MVKMGVFRCLFNFSIFSTLFRVFLRDGDGSKENHGQNKSTSVLALCEYLCGGDKAGAVWVEEPFLEGKT